MTDVYLVWDVVKMILCDCVPFNIVVLRISTALDRSSEGGADAGPL